jgi:hypothetical protein
MHLWSSSGSDSGLARELLAQDLLQGHLSSKQRSFFVRHFARVLNLAYAQVGGDVYFVVGDSIASVGL